jgi:membrane-associated HD superfamily phosphohydrolase
MLRDNQSSFFDKITLSKRGNVKVAASQFPGREAVTKSDVKKVLKTFEKSPDVSKDTIEQYKQRAELDANPKQVAKDFFTDLSKARKQKKQMNLITAMSYRQAGIFKVAGRDVYEDLETGDFWKISEDKKHVLRLFKEDENGISDKKASLVIEAGKLNSYSVMGKHPGDGGVVEAESFDDAAAEFFSQDGDYTKEEILEELKKRPGKKISDTEYEYGDYEVKLITEKTASLQSEEETFIFSTSINVEESIPNFDEIASSNDAEDAVLNWLSSKSFSEIKSTNLDDIVSEINFVAEDVVESLKNIIKEFERISK